MNKPVAWIDREGDLYDKEPPEGWCPPHEPLYKAPKRLTDEQIARAWANEEHNASALVKRRITRAIEDEFGIWSQP